MAQVPVAQGNRVQLRPVAGNTYDVVEDNSVQRIGRSIQQFGETMGQAAVINDQIDAALDEAAVRRLDAEDSEWLRQRLWTGENAYFRQRGLDAVNARPLIEEEMRARRQERREDLGSDRARSMYERVSASRFGQEFEGIARYAGEQADRENDLASQARIAEEANNAQLAGTDDVRRNTHLGVAEQEIWAVIDRQGGSPARAQQAIRELRSNVHYSIALNLANSDPVEAYQYRVRHAGEMEADEILRLDTALDSSLDARQDMEEEEAIVEDRVSRDIRAIAAMPPPPEPVEAPTVDLSALLERAPPDADLGLFVAEGTNGVAVLLPTLGPDGQRMSRDEAISFYRATGQHMGMFRTATEAQDYAVHLNSDVPTTGSAPNAAVATATTAPAVGAAPSVPAMSMQQFWQTAIIGQESGGRQTDASGRTLIGRDRQGRVPSAARGGPAYGAGQMQLGTARGTARKHNIAWDQNRFLTDRAYNLQLSRLHFNDLYTKYGDLLTAAAAYHSGEPNVDRAIRRHGRANFVQGLGPEGQHYVAAVAQRVGGTVGPQGQAPVGAGPQASDLGELRRRLEARNLPPEQRERVWQRLQLRVAREQAIINQRQGHASDRALEHIANLGQNFTDVGQIPREIYVELSPQQRIQYQGWADSNRQRQLQGQAPRTDSTLFAGLSDAYARDPNAFLQIRPEQVRARLDDEDFNTYLGWRRNAREAQRRPAQNQGDQRTTINEIMDVSRELLRASGLQLGERAPQRDAQAVAEFQGVMVRWAEQFRRNHSRAPTAAEIREAADRNLIQVQVPRGGIMGGSDRRFGFQVPGNVIRAGDPNARVVVPAEIRNRIMQAYEQHGRPAPDERTIQETYLRGVWENRW